MGLEKSLRCASCEVPESVDSYLKSEDATDYLDVIQAGMGPLEWNSLYLSGLQHVHERLASKTIASRQFKTQLP